MEPSRSEPPPFPRAVSRFVGRDVELARLRALLPREALFLVYGVAGIGKSELVYKLVEEARALPALRRAATIAVSARPRLRCEHLFASLRQSLGAPAPEGAAGLAGDLHALVKALESRRPALIFIDDAHHLDAEAAGEALGFLARHVSKSRIFVASRIEILLPPDTPPAVVCRLSPLSGEATAAMVASLGDTLGLRPPDPAAVFARSSGSPLYILRELSELRYAPRRGEDPLVAALRELSPELRHALLLARLLHGRLAPAELGPGEALWELSRRFLIDIDHGAVLVPDLIGEALFREASAEAVQAAQRDAARLLLRRAEGSSRERAEERAALAIEAARHLAAAGDPGAAWATLERFRGTISRVGLDHLALELMPALRAALPAPEQQDVALRMAQLLLRRNRLAEAQGLLDDLGAADTSLLRAPRFLRLSAEVATHAGALELAAALLEEAQRAASEPEVKLCIALELALVQARRGEGRRARHGLLDAALRARRERAALAPVGANASAPRAQGALPPEDEARFGWARALSFLLEDRPEAAAAAAVRAAARLPESPQMEAARAALARVELIARAGCDEVDTAAARLLRVQRHAAHAAASLGPTLATARPTPMVALSEGVVYLARGRLADARASLVEAREALSAQSDRLPSATAGYYLARALLGLGDDEGARAEAEAAAQQAAEARLAKLTPRFAALLAEIHLEALRLDEAEAALAKIFAAKELARPRTLSQAEALRALLCGLRGEATAAREAIDRAATHAQQDGSEAARHELHLSAARTLLLVGDAEASLARATEAAAHYAARGRMLPQAVAALLRAAALAVRAELGEAEAQLAFAEERAEQQGYALPWAPLVTAALARHRGEERLAREALAAGLRGLKLPGAGSDEASADRAPPGLLALLRSLDLVPRAEAVSAASAPAPGPRADGAAVEDEERYDIVVDLQRNILRAPGREEQVTGRPLLCALLAHLTQDAAGHSAERLFYEVWGGREYHPLRHRNTIYVAILRLRRVLQVLVPGRDVVETTAQGWRLSAEISRYVIPAVPKRAER